MPEHVYKRLVDQKLVDGSHTFGIPNAAGDGLGALFLRSREKLLSGYEEVDHTEAAELVRGSLSLAVPEDDKNGIFDILVDKAGLDRGNFDDPKAWEKTLRGIASDPAAVRSVSAEMATMMAFLGKVGEAVEKFPPHLDLHYRGDLRAIGKDLVRDLGLGEVTDDEVVQALMVFLQYDGDDEDPDPEPAPVPEDGEKVVA
jgi:hypothetical protein